MKILPIKFESILRADTLAFGPLIMKVDSDLRRFRKLDLFGQAQGAGLLAVIEGPPGQGKTTAAYAASVLLNDRFNAVVPVPPSGSLDLKDIPQWLTKNLATEATSKTTIVLIDGRESTSDEQGLLDVMGGINNLVRGRPDLLFVWPTTDPGWRDRLVETARSFGSASFCPDDAIVAVDGPAKENWTEAVGLIMTQLDSSWDEFGINEESASQLVDDYDTLGDFFTAINQIRVDQEDYFDNPTGLPQLVFVVSSHSPIVGHVARLRNPTSYQLRTDEVIGSARRTDAGKFWIARGAKANTNLGWVSALLGAKLVALTPSTVAHACGTEAPAGSRLRATLNDIGFVGNRSTGTVAYKTTDLARFLDGKPVPEVLSSNKGKTSESVVAAYDKIQALSSRQHLAINRAILSFVGKQSGHFSPADVQYEVDLGGDAVVDAIVPLEGRRLHFELHHLSGAKCSPNKIADYMMKKLRVYGVQYNLIDR